MSAPVDRLLPLLENVRRSGPGWRANCPVGHSSRGTLAIAESDAGGALVHCHAGCTAAQVLGALGLQATDLFPPRERKDQTPADRRENRERLALASVRASAAVLDVEGRVVAMVAAAMQRGEPIEPENLGRFLTACARIEAARAALAREVRR